MALAINGTPGHTLDVTGATSTVSANITTTVADTIIIAVIGSYQQLNGSAVRTVTGVSGGGLTWAKRKANSGTVSNIFAGQEVWWAYSSAIQTAASITATFNITPNQACDIEVFAVSGSTNFASPWDVNASLPAAANHMNTTTATLPTVSGTDTSILALQLEFCTIINNGLTGTTVGAGFTNISPSPITSGTIRSMWGSKSTSSAGAQTYPFVNNQNFWLVIGDALLGDIPSNTATISTALTKASISAAGKETFTGTVATHLTKVSQSAAGKETSSGTISMALTKASISAAGKESFTGTVSTVLTKISQVVQGNEAVIANSVTTSLTKISQSGTATEIFTGVITTALSGISQSATAEGAFTGAITTALSGISQDLVGAAGSGLVAVTGTVDMSLSGIAQAVLAREVFSASVETDLSGISQALFDKEIFTGSIITALSGISQEVDGTASELMIGTIVTTLTGISQALFADEDFVGHITMHLGEAGQLISTDVQALEIIEGPIVMDLSGFGQVILGGSLGTPGSGKWYSYRYLDS